MKFLNKYTNINNYNVAKSNLTQLKHYCAYVYNEDNMVVQNNNQNQIHIITYSVNNNIINICKQFNNQIPLITRCDLFKKIYINGKEIDLTTKAQTPYDFKGNTTKEIIDEASKLIITEKGFNEKYVLLANGMEKNGVIKVILKDNIPPKSLSCMFISSLAITYIQPTLLKNLQPIYMCGFFSYCVNLEKLDLSTINPINIKNIDMLFYNCSNLKQITLYDINPSLVDSYKNVFDNCNSLYEIFCSQQTYDWLDKNQTQCCLPNYTVVQINDGNK